MSNQPPIFHASIFQSMNTPDSPLRIVHGVTIRASVPQAGRGELEDQVATARENGAIPELPTYGVDQVHGDTIIWIDKPMTSSASIEILKQQAAPVKSIGAADALATDQPHILLAIRTADCLPVFIVEPKAKLIGLAHCGWRGLIAGLAGKTTHMLKQKGGRPAIMQVWLAPCIQADDYEVGEELVEKFKAAFPDRPKETISPNGTHLNIPAIARYDLMQQGILETNIETSPQSTRSDENCHSYRRDAEASGRMISYLGMMQ